MIQLATSPAGTTGHDGTTAGDASAGAQRERVLRPGLSAESLMRQLLRARDESDVGQRSLAFYLHDMAERKLHQSFGFSSADQLAEARLHISRRRARELIRCGRMLRELPLLDAAFRDGSLSWTIVRLLLRVVEPDTERGWVELAKTVSYRELNAKVLRSRKGDTAQKADGKGLPEVTFRFTARIRALTQAMLDKAREKAGAILGEEVTDDLLLGTLCGAFLEQRAPGQDRERHSSFQVVARHDPAADRMEVETSEGRVPVDEATKEMVRCDAAVVSECECAEHGDASQPTPASLRNRMLARDGYRCRCCDARVDLHVHHIRFRSEGGPTVPSNLTTLCMRCHALVHEGLLAVSGVAPHDLRFQDRRGSDLSARQPGAIRIVREGRRGATAPRAEPLEMTLARTPREMDASWWRRHRHLVKWSESRRALELKPGLPRDDSELDEPATCEKQDGPSLDDLVGQRRVIGSLRTAVLAARKQGRPLPHVLLHGPAGCGKTTLARALAREMGVHARVTSGPALDDPSILPGLLSELREGDILFIDEIHALPGRVAEMLYEALAGGSLSIPVFEGARTKTLTLKLSAFTCIGATTEPDRLAGPFLSRFPQTETLELYSGDDLAEITRRWLTAQGLTISDAAARVLAGAALGTARNAESLAARARDVAVARSRQTVGEPEAREALEMAGLDARGLGPGHRKALEVLAERGRPVGTARLASRLGLTRRAFVAHLEPALLRLGLITPTPRGLVLAHPG